MNFETMIPLVIGYGELEAPIKDLNTRQPLGSNPLERVLLTPQMTKTADFHFETARKVTTMWGLDPSAKKGPPFRHSFFLKQFITFWRSRFDAMDQLDNMHPFDEKSLR